jgi:hypothetical protein
MGLRLKRNSADAPRALWPATLPDERVVTFPMKSESSPEKLEQKQKRKNETKHSEPQLLGCV